MLAPLLSLLTLLLSATAFAGTLPPGFQESTVLSGLNTPTAVRFASDGRVFVAEKSGIIKVFDALNDPTPTVFADLSVNVHDFWDRGLLGLALHPDFPATPYVYVLYTMDAPIGGTPPVWFDTCPSPPGPTDHGCVVGARLSRLVAAGNVWTGPENVLIENWCQQFPSHSIGTLDFGVDGALYVSAGDGASFTFVDYGQNGFPQHNPCNDPPGGIGGAQVPPAAEGGALRSQDLRTLSDPVALNGTILRVDPLTGDALPDNPLFGGGISDDDRIVAYGLRNPFRINARRSNGEIWIGDVGWDAWEEVNVLAAPTGAVQNFGWPCYEGPDPQWGYEGTNLAVCEALYDTPDAATPPFFSYWHPDAIVPGDGCGVGTSAVSGLAFYTGGGYPVGYEGALFFADYSRNCIWAMFPGPGGELDPASRMAFDVGASVPVDLQIGPGGDLYYVDIYGGAVHRIRYTAGNRPPIAVAAAAPTNGPVPLAVQFDASQSSDPDGDAITYAWDLDGDGAYDDSTAVAPSFAYPSAGTVAVGLRVTDVHGDLDATTVAITAGNSQPTASIDLPASSLTWNVGQVITFAGSATDPEQTSLPASALSWTLVLHHCPASCHQHVVQSFAGVAGGSFPAPDHEYPSHLELRLTATDAGGLQDTTSVFLYPNDVTLDFASAPPGLTLAVGSGSGAAPFARTVIVGSQVSVTAPDPQLLNGTSYGFSSWSDGGAQSHNAVAPATPATLTATFAPNCASAVCGDGAVVPGCEPCDLGAGNCAPGVLCAADCTSTCRLIGRCTQSGTTCASVADCPPAEGCCGDRVQDAGEGCDDGNRLGGDCCSAVCQIEAGACEPQSCPAFGPHLVAANVKLASTKDGDQNGSSERWKTRGTFTLPANHGLDPDGAAVVLQFSENGSVLYAPVIPPGNFAQKGAVCPMQWSFKNAHADLPSAVGWKAARVKRLKEAGGSAGACGASVQYKLDGGSNAPMANPTGAHLRQSLVIGDDCYTALLTCTPVSKGFKCAAP